MTKKRMTIITTIQKRRAGRASVTSVGTTLAERERMLFRELAYRLVATVDPDEQSRLKSEIVRLVLRGRHVTARGRAWVATDH
jgi:hypothetical protein